MVESRLIDPDVGTFLHQLVGIVEDAVGRQRYVAMLRDHYLHLHATLDGIFQCLLQFAVECEIRVDEFY